MKLNSTQKFSYLIKSIALFVVGVSIVAPFVVLAVDPLVPVNLNDVGLGDNVNAPIKSISGGNGSVLGLLGTFLRWMAIIFWIAAVGFIFYAAFLYLTASGEPERIKKASHSLLYGVVAIAVALMAYGMPLLVKNILGSG